MPFTLSHPAIILPLIRSKRFSTTALIAGSMVPDFEFFFQMREVENIGHHWQGIFLFDFPIAFICCLVFHNLLRNSLIINMPALLKDRVIHVMNFDWNDYALKNKLKVTLSLSTGITSHILWDGFTHYDGMFTEMFSVLAMNIEILSFVIPVYFLLQIAFSLIGLFLICVAIIQLPKQKSDTIEKKSSGYWNRFMITVSIFLVIRLAGWPEYNSFWGVFMAVMGSICYSWIIISLNFKKYFTNKFKLWISSLIFSRLLDYRKKMFVSGKYRISQLTKKKASENQLMN